MIDEREPFACRGDGRVNEEIHVVGLTNMRVRELQLPFEAMGNRGTLVTLEPSVRGYLSALREGALHVRRRNADAILVYNGAGLLGVVAATLSRYYGVPLLIRLNGDIRRQHREKAVEYYRRRDWASLATHVAFAALSRAAFELADGFVPVSKSLKGIVQRQTGCSAERVRAVPNPLEPDEYDVSDPEPIVDRRADGHLVLTVTNLNFRGKYEGVVEAVDALLPLLRRRPSLEYAIAGDGRYYDRLGQFLDERIDDASVRNRVHAPGYVEDVADLYAAADVFVYISYIDAYPNVILEAQAAELPIVSNLSYGTAEQIDDGESGIFVDPDEKDSITRAVSSLLDDPDVRRRLGRNSRRRVDAENAPSLVGRQLYDAVRAIVNAKTGGSAFETIRQNSRRETKPNDD